MTIDKLSLKDGIKAFLLDHSKIIDCLESSADQILIAIEGLYSVLSENNGRIIYVGAGTSGRIGVQDGVELYPTFSWPVKRIGFIIAGGAKALTKSIENAEDDEKQAQNEFKKLKLCSHDVIVAISASGNTPFTCKILNLAQKSNILSVGVFNNKNGRLKSLCDIPVLLDTGEEIVSGSTRLKAGTAQKICLNIISSLLMTKFGHVKKGQMISMVPLNAKLRKRKKLIEELING